MAATSRLRLGVNVDHVATIRNARGGKQPDPVKAALAAVAAGADSITAHLREDRRHIRDDDVVRLKAQLGKPLNFEMAATREMIDIALKIRPHAVCLVPERRQERTTEGGLDLARSQDALTPVVAELKGAGIRVSLFIAGDARQIEAAAAVGAPVVELHTGAWCEAVGEGRAAIASVELQRIKEGAARARRLGLEVHAGHGLDFRTAETVAAFPEVVELNIGHFLVAEAVLCGLAEAVRTMRAAMDRGRARLGAS